MANKETQYPFWKMVAWRFLRAGVAGGVSTILSIQLILRPDFSNGNIYFTSLLSAFIAGFISGGGLALRDALSENKDDTIQKLPI